MTLNITFPSEVCTEIGMIRNYLRFLPVFTSKICMLSDVVKVGESLRIDVCTKFSSNATFVSRLNSTLYIAYRSSDWVTHVLPDCRDREVLPEMVESFLVSSSREGVSRRLSP